MKKYLSSYKIGNNPERLFDLFGENKKIAFISNARDMYTDVSERVKREQVDIDELEDIGLEVEKLDLGEYFGKKGELKEKLQEFGGAYVVGGNTFVLRHSYKLSGLDEILAEYEKNRPDFVYSGYSAGVCIFSPTLKGYEIVDDANIFPYEEIQETIWEGLGIIDYSISPHYKSDHPESELVDKVVDYCIDNKVLFKALRDGEVLIYE